MNEQLPEGTVTLLFTDVEGSTDITRKAGDEAARDLLRSHEEIVRGQIDQHGGRVVKSMGDGFMVAFSSARRAVRCAVGIQRALDDHNRTHAHDLKVRIGLNTGEVSSEGGDLFGEAVNAASRIAAAAKGGEILLSEITRALAGNVPEVTISDRGEVPLKGFPEPWRLFEVGWQQEQPHVRSDRTPFAGRLEESAELRRLLKEAAEGKGSAVLIGGNPGVGKTRLAEELAAEAANLGMLPLVGRCYEMEGAPPYVPFVEVLESARKAVSPETFRSALGDEAGEVARIVPDIRRLFPDIPPALELPPDQERRYLFNSIGEFVGRACGMIPLFVLLDDVHWADESSLLLAEHLAERVRDLPAFIIATYRDVELDVNRPLARTLEQLLRRRLAHRITLKPLPQDAVRSMLEGLAGQDPPDSLVGAIFDATEGNPFFVEEVFKHLREEGKLFDDGGRFRGDLNSAELGVPEGVRLVIGRRLEHLGDQGRRALSAAALMGRGFNYSLLESLHEVDPDALLDAIDGAESANLIVSSSASWEVQYRFAHDLIRRTLIDSLSLPRQQRLHLRIAESMERLYSDDLDEHVADIAHHLYQAGAAADSTKTVTYLVRAAAKALDASAYEEALRHYDNALGLVPPDDLRLTGELLYNKGLALRSLVKGDEALAVWREALSAYEKIGDAEEIGHMCWEIGYQAAWSFRWAECLEMAHRGLSALGDRANKERVTLLVAAGAVSALAGSYEEGTRMLAQAKDLVERVPGRGGEAEVYLGECVVRSAWADPKGAIQSGEAAIRLFRGDGRLWDLATTQTFVQTGYWATGQMAEADRISEEALPVAKRLGHLGAELFCNTNSQMLGLRLDRLDGWLDERVGYLDEQIRLSEQAELPQSAFMYSWRGCIEWWAGRDEQARGYFEEGVRREIMSPWEGWAAGMMFLYHGWTGEREAAMKIWDEWRDRMPSPDVPYNLGAAMMGLAGAEVLYLLGEMDEAAALYGFIADGIEQREVVWRPLDLRLQHVLAGMTAVAGDDWHKAIGHFEEALVVSERLRHPVQLFETKRIYADALAKHSGPGDRERARSLAEEALAGFESIGMPREKKLTAELVGRL